MKVTLDLTLFPSKAQREPREIADALSFALAFSAFVVSVQSITFEHSRDSDCQLGEDLCCVGCGVSHGEPCARCEGKGFHKPTCIESDENRQHDFAFDVLCDGHPMAGFMVEADAVAFASKLKDVETVDIVKTENMTCDITFKNGVQL